MVSFLVSRNQGKKEIYQIHYDSNLNTGPDEASQWNCKKRLKEESQNKKYESSCCFSMYKRVI